MALNTFMHNVEKWPNILQKSGGVHTARFLKYVWSFSNVMHERVKELYYQKYFPFSFHKITDVKFIGNVSIFLNGAYWHFVKSVCIRSFSGPYFPAFGLNTERYGECLSIQSKCGKIQTINNSEYGHFSLSVGICLISEFYLAPGQISISKTS